MSTLPQIFWDRVQKTETCWVWTASKFTQGYGRFWMFGRSCKSHRLTWEDKFGPIPPRLVIDHLCRNRACCNPAHLRVVTQRVNILENSLSIQAINAKKTECPKGHEYSIENTYLDPKRGCRQCRECKRIIGRKCDQKLSRKDYHRQYQRDRRAKIKAQRLEDCV